MRILVVDDHEVVRRGICSVLATESSLTLCGEAVDGKDAVEKAKVLRPDIIVMDITMPQMNGLDATREIKRLLPELANDHVFVQRLIGEAKLVPLYLHLLAGQTKAESGALLDAQAWLAGASCASPLRA